MLLFISIARINCRTYINAIITGCQNHSYYHVITAA